MVCVNGNVEYGGEPETYRLFSEEFILAQDKDEYYFVFASTFRWVGNIKKRVQTFDKKFEKKRPFEGTQTQRQPYGQFEKKPFVPKNFQ